MNYEINVSKNGRHVFTTSEGSIRTLGEASDIIKRLEIAFPKDEGFFVTIAKRVVIYSPVPNGDLIMSN